MANQPKRTRSQELWAEWSVQIMVVAAFALGAGGTWAIMRASASGPSRQQPRTVQSISKPPATQPPDVSKLAPAEAARTLADWNYDRQNWGHAIEHYQQAIALGADNPDVRTDLGSCFRFLGQPQKALEQYERAQKQNPLHENSLFNQVGLFTEVLHDDQRALAAAREFMTRFPQSPRTESARQLVARLQKESEIDH